MVIIETSIFTKQLEDLMPDDEYRTLQAALVGNPGLGQLICQLAHVNVPSNFGKIVPPNFTNDVPPVFTHNAPPRIARQLL